MYPINDTWTPTRYQRLPDGCTDDHLCRCPRCKGDPPEPTESVAPAPRKARKVWTLEERRERSLQLADEHGVGVGSCRFYEVETDPWSGELVSVTVDVASSSQRYTDGTPILYQVTYEAASDSARCNCGAAWFGAPCKHAGATIRYGRLAADAYTPATRDEQARIERDLERQERQEQNAAALDPSL